MSEGCTLTRRKGVIQMVDAEDLWECKNCKKLVKHAEIGLFEDPSGTEYYLCDVCSYELHGPSAGKE